MASGGMADYACLPLRGQRRTCTGFPSTCSGVQCSRGAAVILGAVSRLFRDVDGAALCAHGSVVCIGAFDGLHRGHQALVRQARARARARAAECVVVSFEPLPREFFAPPAAQPARLTLPAAKLSLLAGLGVDRVGLLRFSPRLAAMSAEDFVDTLLVRRLAACEVWVGPGFRFGHRRAGDLALLQRLGARFGFSAESIVPVEFAGERVSASAVRAALAAGDLGAAADLLGRPYTITGRVVRGAQLGRKLGYPTANIRLGGRLPALSGIFATRVHGVGYRTHPSVSSLGTRPTVHGREPLLEAHLFDFDGDLYGQRIEVEFVHKLRDEASFPDLPALVRQMHEDARQARALLNAPPANH